VAEIHAYLTEILGNRSDARHALLAESKKAKQSNIASQTPASEKKHLFGKQFGSSVQDIVDSWWPHDKAKKKMKKRSKAAVAQSCPDFAFRAPFHIVFEAKLFKAGGVQAAKHALVNGIYQCFFYRALPKVISKEHRAWDYDYACLLIYDASGQNTVATAWRNALDIVKKSCWDTANIYVMILPAPI